MRRELEDRDRDSECQCEAAGLPQQAYCRAVRLLKLRPHRGEKLVPFARQDAYIQQEKRLGFLIWKASRPKTHSKHA